MRRTAFVYVVTGDDAVGQNEVAQLMNLAAWDPDGATSYATHDQVHRAITWKGAVAYDWCHDLLTADQRKQIRDMVRTRTLTMFRSLAENRPLKRRPHDSHGWTALGCMGVVALALSALLISEEGRTEDLLRIREGYRLLGAEEQFHFAYYPKYADPGSRPYDDVPLPEGLTPEEYLEYANVDVPNHCFKGEVAAPWLVEKLGR